ncbi:DNA translocase FtsK [uncultured Phascolarctobacterium sp.]|uniref:DNA translocase FtsK n=1 Tax=uncultured Phascolarctobacterium sp. TaxID=512296 RepID=UPI0025F73C18|nr:DNA translocase FtsK [uncultured Phascolarctobacterium sp.]
MRRTKAERTEQQNNSRLEISGVLLLALGCFAAAVYLGLPTGTIGAFVDKIMSYTLGKGAFLFPLACIALGIRFSFTHRGLGISKKGLALTLLTLCLLGTAHHVFVPVAGEELIPEHLKEGGGLLGGVFLLALRRLAGTAGALIILLAGIICSVLLTGKLSLKASAETAGRKAKNIVTYQNQDIETTAETSEFKNMEVLNTANPYNSEEFSGFTSGIKKESQFKQILRKAVGRNAASTEEAFLENEQPFIEEFPVIEKNEPHIITRPIIDFNKPKETAVPMPEQDFLNPYKDQSKNQASGNIKIIDTADKNIAADLPVPKKTVSEKLQPEVPPAAEPSTYLFPPLELLNPPYVSKDKHTEEDIREQCAILEQTLEDFRVRASVVAVTRGPSVTRFELEPAPGVKVSSVVNLADDIALKLAASGVRIEAPIPGKAAIGIEVPNRKNDPVFFREVVDCDLVRQTESKLCVGLGKDISGNIITVDLSKMPHMLVAGSTGSGKSVCINTIIAGILYKARPEEVKMILVDPKVVELSNYNGIPHLLTPVVTDSKKAASALHWAVAEMERRYKAFADNHVREINSYNAQAAEKMPFIVIIIDELADLMMVAKVDVEDAILRLAQKARAAGIHLILATQRPSVDVITGIVKANIPSRIAFAVSSQTDSRTILDMGGAEKLLGKGDMLFYPIGTNKPVRVQGAFVSDSELNKIVDFIKKQSIPVEYSEEVTQQALESDSKGSNGMAENGNDLMSDELFEDAVRLVMDTGQASSSMLQRKFRIGYTRAARLVDCMEELGIIGQSVGSKPRELIMSRHEIEERFFTAQ